MHVEAPGWLDSSPRWRGWEQVQQWLASSAVEKHFVQEELLEIWPGLFLTMNPVGVHAPHVSWPVWFLVVWQPWMSWQHSMNSEKDLMTAFPTPLVGPGVQLGFWTGFRICGMMALLLEGDLLHICEQLRCFLLQWTPKGILSNSAHRWSPGRGWSSAVGLVEHLWRPEFDPQTINKAKSQPQQRADYGDCCASGFDFFWTLPSLSMCSHAMKFI